MRSSFVIAAALAAAVAGTDAPPQRLRKPKDAGKKLLWPLMTMGGPNNQYLQLLESMLLAEALGRALVAAPFLKWLNARGRDVRAFNETFDAAAVGRFVAVARVAELPRAHALGAVVVHAGRGSAVKQRDLATVCAMARARCAKKPFARPLVDDSSKRRCAKVPKPDGSYAACVAERYAHHEVVAASLWGSIPSLYGAIAAPRTLRAVAALRRAPRVRAAAARLRRALFGTERYVCAHLRRVEDDQRCKDGGKASFPRVACFPGTSGYASTASIAGAIRAVAAAARAPAVYVARAAPRKKSWPGQQKGDSTSLQLECFARARSRKSAHASRPFQKMIARPKISRNELKPAEKGAFEVGNFALFCCPVKGLASLLASATPKESSQPSRCRRSRRCASPSYLTTKRSRSSSVAPPSPPR